MTASELSRILDEHAATFGAIAAASVAFVVVGAALGPFLIARLPADYFSPRVMSRRLSHRRSLAVKVARNLAGFALLFAGILMLVLPGQGLLTILASLVLVDFPMKKRVMLKLVQNARVRASLDWLRRRVGKEPFHWS